MTSMDAEASRMDIDHRVNQLIADMTTEEKIAQLCSVWSYEVMESNQFSPLKASAHFAHGIGQITRIGGATNLDARACAELANAIQHYLLTHTRLKIPAMVHEESCSGYMAKGATCFPQTIGIASTWNPEIAKQLGEIIRKQMRAAGAHQALAPLLDVARDPRWGRTEETFGEDPYLTSQMGIGYVRGLQGESLRDGVVATGKHFVGYGASLGGMNWAPVMLPDRELREVYLHPFEAVVREAKIGAIMPGYHELDGVPCHDSKRLLKDTLRDTWKFDGLIVSDYFAISNLHEYHHVAATREEAAKLAIEAGVDVELPSRDIYGDALMQALESGMVGMEDIHQLLRRVLRFKFELGLFDHPYVDERIALDVFDSEEQRQVARTAAHESIVLLKNDASILPLAKDTHTLAVIGPNADTMRNLVGDYAYPCHIETLLEMRDKDNVFHTAVPEAMEATDQFVPMHSILHAIRQSVSDGSTVIYERGCGVTDPDPSGVEAAVQAALKSDVAIVIVGDKAGLTDECTTGEARDRATLGLLGIQEQLVKAVYETGTPTVVVYVNGRPISSPWIDEHVPAIMEAWLPGEEGAEAVADVLFGDYNPSGRLPITVPRTVGQVPLYYGHKPSGARSHWKGPYVDESNLPLYAFGYGLSYTQFEYGDLRCSQSTIGVHDTVDIACTVKNVGRRSGDEVVQLYIRDCESTVTRPVLELRGFARIHLEAGEEKRVTFALSSHQFAFYDRDMAYVVEPGEVKIHIGSSSDHLPLTASLAIVGESTDVEHEKVFTTPVFVEALTSAQPK